MPALSQRRISLPVRNSPGPREQQMAPRKPKRRAGRRPGSAKQSFGVLPLGRTTDLDRYKYDPATGCFPALCADETPTHPVLPRSSIRRPPDLRRASPVDQRSRKPPAPVMRSCNRHLHSDGRQNDRAEGYSRHAAPRQTGSSCRRQHVGPARQAVRGSDRRPASVLHNGRALIAGGRDRLNRPSTTADVFDPAGV
jgi:hypothetical protein